MLSGLSAQAEDVDVPRDELVQETVYPVFDNPISIKNSEFNSVMKNLNDKKSNYKFINDRESKNNQNIIDEDD